MKIPDDLVPIELVPVEVFGADDCEHPGCEDPRCPGGGYGLSDAVSAWSDCNRAEGKIYRVEDLDDERSDQPSKYRNPGETVIVWVPKSSLSFFEKRWGDRFVHGGGAWA